MAFGPEVRPVLALRPTRSDKLPPITVAELMGKMPQRSPIARAAGLDMVAMGRTKRVLDGTTSGNEIMAAAVGGPLGVDLPAAA